MNQHHTSTPDSSPTSASAGRQTPAWLLVMRREVMAKATDRSFLVSTVVTVALIAAYLGFVAWSAQRTHEVTIAAVGSDASMAQAVEAASTDDLVVSTSRFEDEADARAALVDESVDAWLHSTGEGWTLSFATERDDDLTQLASGVVASQVLAENARTAGTDLASLERGTSLSTVLLDGDQDRADLAEVVGFAFAFLFYLATIMFGMQLATSVVEEKQSRIVEIIAAAIPLRHLLAGKILGNTVLALAQVLLYAAVGLVGLSFTEFGSFVPDLSGPVLWFLAFFTAGFFALACLWAVAGALASRNEDLQSTTTPLVMTLVLVFITALNVDGSTERVLSFVPPFSAILMPKRLLAQDPPVWEPMLAVALLLAAAGLLVLVGERLYRRALLQTSGKVSIKQAWQAEA